MAALALSPGDRAMLGGGRGEGPRLAMRLVTAMARSVGAERLIDVTSAHVDSCLYHGQVGVDFAVRLAGVGARVGVPTSLNVSSLDLLHPDRYRGDPASAEQARRLMDLYVEMGCRPTWTCAPYQLRPRPARGEHVAWAESNAIAFVNSVLGARTDRYGDFIDICAAITGRVPDAGFHRTERRVGQVLLRLAGVPERLLGEDALFPVLGHLVGLEAGVAVPVVEGLRSATEDQLKAFGAAAASSGGVGMFHVVGLTPEAPTLDAAFGWRAPARTVDVTLARLREARDDLSTARGPAIGAVSLGTPHLSLDELEDLARSLDGARVATGVALYLNTGRDVLAEAAERGLLEPLERAGATVVTDTCTYITPVIDLGRGPVMTDSGKWAYYAPGTIGAQVVFGSRRECLRSAVLGEVWRDERLWADG
jgi:predicted aconitase